jgi:acyl-CoA dehydrogenase
LRDSQVLPIWEGTTNVLALDTLRALGAAGVHDAGGSIRSLISAVTQMFEPLRDPQLTRAAQKTLAALNHAEDWLRKAQQTDESTLEAGARRFALTLGRATELALLIKHAKWSLDHEHDHEATTSAHRFAQAGVDLIFEN